MIEARALVALLVAGEQHPADAIPFSAFLAVETYRQARVQPRKKGRFKGFKAPHIFTDYIFERFRLCSAFVCVVSHLSSIYRACFTLYGPF